MVTVVVYVTISYGNYTEARRAAEAGPEDASRHQILEDKQWGMRRDVDWLPPSFLQAAKGIYHVKEAIASSTLQIAPSAYIYTHAHTFTRARLRAGPLPLDCSQWQRGYILAVTVALCRPP